MSFHITGTRISIHVHMAQISTTHKTQAIFI